MNQSFFFVQFVLMMHFYILNAEPSCIEVESSKDYEVLDKFFKMGIQEEGYNYVWDGEKPISIRNFYSPSHPLPKNLELAEEVITQTLLVQEVIPVWKKLCSFQKKFVLKAVPLNPSEPLDLGWEVQFINVDKLQQVIEENINLFRYILGPTIQPKELVNQIAYSNENFSDILLNNHVLEGIVLGFGAHNSVVGGREETINSLLVSQDVAPFTSKSLYLGELKDYYSLYYLDTAGGDHSLCNSLNDFIQFKPSVGFSNIEEELLAINAINEPLPNCLLEKPKFIFGAFTDGPNNQPFFDRLAKSQKEAQRLLKKTDFLEEVLTKIGGTPPRITCEKPISSELNLSFFRGKMSVQTWKYILDKVARRFEGEHKLTFIRAFSNSSNSYVTPDIVGASKASLEGIKKANHNLSMTNAYFDRLSSDTSLQAILPKYLYFKTISTGSGKELRNFDRIRLGYMITNINGDILFANYDTWLNVSETIPGFAHGLQGMRIGEKRHIFIHPSLAYGVLTTLSPCMGLVAKVELHDIDEKLSKSLPNLQPLDLSWIQNPSIYQKIEESLHQLPSFSGSFYRNLLNKIEGPERATSIIEAYKQDRPKPFKQLL